MTRRLSRKLSWENTVAYFEARTEYQHAVQLCAVLGGKSMKTPLLMFGLLAGIALATTSTVPAYRIGYRTGYHQGGSDERSCWGLDPAPPEAWRGGEIVARRDTTKHPFLKGRVALARASRMVNSVPVSWVP